MTQHQRVRPDEGHEEDRSDQGGESLRTVLTASGANLLIALAKGTAALLTGSAALWRKPCTRSPIPATSFPPRTTTEAVRPSSWRRISTDSSSSGMPSS